jgi:hypothetical protein
MVPAARGISPPCINEDVVPKWRKLTKDILDEERRTKINEGVGLDGLGDTLE